MYDLITTALLFVILTPGVVLTIPPGASVITAAIVHAVVFYVVQAFVSRYVPWWGIWIIAAVVIGARMYTPSAPTY